MDTLWTMLLGFLGVSGLGAAALFLTLGGGAVTEVLKAVNHGIGALAPAFQLILERLLKGVLWVWDHVLVEGLKDIFDNKATIATVILVGFVLWQGQKFTYEAHIANRQAAINECYAELAKLRKRPVAAPREAPAARFPLPWDGIFGK
jgi:hypothetical protein